MNGTNLDELGGFLRSRRARIRPQDADLPDAGRRRRVPGLRREEVARLAGVSVDYYVRLEQGRGHNVSDAVLDAVARVLRLDATERAHLYDLARPPREAVPPAPAAVRPQVRTMLDAIQAPAFLLGRCMDVLAWNALGDAVVGFSAMPPGERNMARRAFLDPAARTLYPRWTEVAAETAAYLRLDAARHPGDPRMTALVAELSAGNPEFRALWEDHTVQEKAGGRKLIRHPVVGTLDVGYETLALPGDPDQLIVVYVVAPDSAEAEKLAFLATAASGSKADATV
ncbi:helix-turn-helix transcriptional regulator [Streptosporangium sandarakinum]|uniref:helix-turn-helix transcriptional regulator n=1 Tax=Streptosporangium TaxID=2000 RepID=UPI0031F9F6C6